MAAVLVPPDWGSTYFEPFLGAGSVFFALNPREAVLGDTNAELIQTYKTVRRYTARVIRLLKRYPYDEGFYYGLRASHPADRIAQAARFLYLNRASWNGLYRVSRSGQFNTPFGRYRSPGICDEDRIRTAALRLRSAKLIRGDFAVTLSTAKSGDLVYLDPPYTARRGNNGFSKYNADLFSWEDQIRLADAAQVLAKNGVHVLVSNIDHQAVVSMYHGFNYYRLARRSLISSRSSSRERVYEALLSSYRVLNLETKVIPW